MNFYLIIGECNILCIQTLSFNHLSNRVITFILFVKSKFNLVAVIDVFLMKILVVEKAYPEMIFTIGTIKLYFHPQHVFFWVVNRIFKVSLVAISLIRYFENYRILDIRFYCWEIWWFKIGWNQWGKWDIQEVRK